MVALPYLWRVLAIVIHELGDRDKQANQCILIEYYLEILSQILDNRVLDNLYLR
jgi:hypothetical protein